MNSNLNVLEKGLNELLDFLIDFDRNPYWTNYSTASPSEIDIFKKEIDLFIASITALHLQPIHELIFQRYNLAIIAGEYYSVGIDEKIILVDQSSKKIALKFNLFISQITDLQLSVNLEKFDKQQKNFIGDLDEFNSLFWRLHKNLDYKLDFQSQEIFLKALYDEIISFSEIEKLIEDASKFLDATKGPSGLDPLERAFPSRLGLYINIKIAEMDNILKCDLSTLYELIKIRDYLSHPTLRQGSGGFILVDVLDEKCSLLIYKIMLRYKNDHLIYDDTNLENIIKLNDYNYQWYYFDNLFVENTKRIYVSFSSENEMLQVKKMEVKVINLQQGLKFSDIHFLSKYYSHICKLELGITKEEIDIFLQKTNLLIQYFEKTYNSHRQSSDKFQLASYESMLHFLHNNKLKLICKKVRLYLNNTFLTKESFSDLKRNLDDALNQVKFIESDLNIRKYKSWYPYWKISALYNDIVIFLTEQLKNYNPGRHFIFNLVAEFTHSINSLRENLEWCSERAIMPVYMPLEECLFEQGTARNSDLNSKYNQSIKVFVDSSYALPNNYKLQETKRRNLTGDLVKNRASIFNEFIYQNLADRATKADVVDLASAKELEKGLQEIAEVKRDQKEYISLYIRILAVFAAIIVYGFGSINVVPRLSTMREIVIFMTSFAASLAIFTFLIGLSVSHLHNGSTNINSGSTNASRFWKGLHKYWYLLMLAIIGLLIWLSVNFASADFDKPFKSDTSKVLNISTSPPNENPSSSPHSKDSGTVKK